MLDSNGYITASPKESKQYRVQILNESRRIKKIVEKNPKKVDTELKKLGIILKTNKKTGKKSISFIK